MTSIICMSLSHIPLLNAVEPLHPINYALNIKYNINIPPYLILMNKKNPYNE